MQGLSKESSIRPEDAAIADILSGISDSKSLSLFKAVAHSDSNPNSRILITQLGLNRRQYYSITQKLMRSCLIRRIHGKYSLTSLGKIMLNCILKIEMSIKYYWKLKAIDSIATSVDVKELPTKEYEMIVNNLIDNDEIKTTLVSKNKPSSFQPLSSCAIATSC